MNNKTEDHVSFEQLISSLHRLSHSLGKESDLLLQETFGFGMSQFKIVWMLKKHAEGVAQKDIAKWLNQTEAAVSRQMQPMVGEELISVRVDPENRRARRVYLTTKGNDFAGSAIKCMEQVQCDTFSVLSTKEQAQLHRLLSRVFTQFCKKNKW